MCRAVYCTDRNKWVYFCLSNFSLVLTKVCWCSIPNIEKQRGFFHFFFCGKKYISQKFWIKKKCIFLDFLIFWPFKKKDFFGFLRDFLILDLFCIFFGFTSFLFWFLEFLSYFLDFFVWLDICWYFFRLLRLLLNIMEHQK